MSSNNRRSQLGQNTAQNNAQTKKGNSGALPRWFGWLTGILAVILPVGAMAGLISWVDWAGLPFLLFLIWTVMTSIILLRRVGTARISAQPSAVSPPSTVT